MQISATVELVSLLALLINMTTANAPGIAAMIGPIHGCAWLFSIYAASQDSRGSTRNTLMAAIPGIGGMLALRRLTHADVAPAQ